MTSNIITYIHLLIIFQFNINFIDKYFINNIIYKLIDPICFKLRLCNTFMNISFESDEFGLNNFEIDVHIFYDLKDQVYTFIDLKDQFKTKKNQYSTNIKVKESRDIFGLYYKDTYELVLRELL